VRRYRCEVLGETREMVAEMAEDIMKRLDEIEEIEGDIESELDDMGLLKANEGRVFYKMSSFMDKARATLKRFLKII